MPRSAPRTRRSPLLAAVATVALAATAFAPAPSEDNRRAALAAGTANIDGIEVTFFTDDDPNTTQPVVLELVRTLDETGYTTGTGRWADRGFAYAYALISEDVCGDLGGPEDQAMVRKIAEFAAGQRPGADDVFLEGVDGRVVAYGVDELAGMLLSSVSSPEGAPIMGVAAMSPVVDPHGVRFSDGGVARSTSAISPTRPLCEDGPDAQVAAVTPYWDARDLSQRASSFQHTSTLLMHDGQGPTDAGQLLDFWRALQDADGPWGPARELVIGGPVAPRFGDPSAQLQPLDHFVNVMLLGDADGRYRSGSPVTVAYNHSDCDLGGCYSAGGFGHGIDLFQRSTQITSLFLNRTFEQDFGCVPVCVPGPGTGEDGTLETVNRYETPWAPVFTWADAGADSERLTADDPLNDGTGIAGDESLPGGHGYHSLAFRTAPVTAPAAIAGRVELDGHFQTGLASGTITPILIQVLANGSTEVIARGAFDLDFHETDTARRHVDGWKAATIRFDMATTHLMEGDRLMVVLQSGNIEHFEPGTVQGTVNVATGPVEGVTTIGAVLHVPTLGAGLRFD